MRQRWQIQKSVLLLNEKKGGKCSCTTTNRKKIHSNIATVMLSEATKGCWNKDVRKSKSKLLDICGIKILIECNIRNKFSEHTVGEAHMGGQLLHC